MGEGYLHFTVRVRCSRCPFSLGRCFVPLPIRRPKEMSKLGPSSSMWVWSVCTEGGRHCCGRVAKSMGTCWGGTTLGIGCLALILFFSTTSQCFFLTKNVFNTTSQCFPLTRNQHQHQPNEQDHCPLWSSSPCIACLLHCRLIS